MSIFKRSSANKAPLGAAARSVERDFGISVAGKDIKILGTGCAKCNALEKATLKAVDESGIKATVSKVEDIVEIMKYNVMTTPALVVDGKVVVKGKVPSVKEIIEIIR